MESETAELPQVVARTTLDNSAFGLEVLMLPYALKKPPAFVSCFHLAERSPFAGAARLAAVLVVVACLPASQALGQQTPNVTLVPYITTVAGNGTACPAGSITGCGEGGPATSAEFNLPGARLDRAGNLYISSAPNNVIWKVDASRLLSRVAGTGTQGYTGDGGQATSATLNNPHGTVKDLSGNLYIVDTGNNVIRKVDTNGVISTFAGTGIACTNPTSLTNPCGDGGPAASAQFHQPVGIAIDSAGNLYTGDELDYRIRKILTNGTITTVAGNGTSGLSSDGGLAANSMLGFVGGVEVDSASNLYLPDFLYNDIRKVDTSGILTTIAGVASTTPGYSPDGTLATSASLNSPHGIVVDSAGTLYFEDAGNNIIRKIDSNGRLRTVVGNATACAVSTDACGDGGPAVNAQLNFPVTLSMDNGGNFYIADYNDSRIREVVNGPVPFFSVPVGSSIPELVRLSFNTTMTLASVQVTPSDYAYTLHPPCGPNVSAPTICEWAVTFTPTQPGPRWGSFTVTDGGGNKDSFGLIGTGVGSAVGFTPGIMSAVAGNGAACSSSTDPCGDGGNATSANLNEPTGIALDSVGNLYIAEFNNSRVRKVTTNGAITTIAGNGTTAYSGDGGQASSAAVNAPRGVAVDSASNVYIADTNNSRIRKIDVNGIITTVAGSPTGYGYSGDGGAATAAQLNFPWGVTVDSAGNLFIADYSNSRIRKVDTNGIITTVAGTGAFAYSGDGGPATSAALNNPSAVVVDSAGNLYIADSDNYCVRKVDAYGIITTIAGSGSAGFYGDGGPATLAQFNIPYSLALDSAGNLYISDTVNQRIRKVDTNGIISTVAGNGNQGNPGDSGPATNARLNYPWGVAVDNAGNFYFAEYFNQLVRKVNVSTGALAFGSVAVGQSSSAQSVAVSDVGNATLNLAGIGFSAGFQATGSSCAVGTPVGIGQTCQLGTVFTPLAAAYTTGTITVADDAFNTPQTINLSGTGATIPIITWANPADSTYGTALSSTQLNATASVPGTFSYIPPAGTVLTVGSVQQLSVTFTPNDLVDYTTATLTVTINVKPAVLTVTADNQVMSYGGPVPTLTASYSGFVNGDTSAVLSGAPALSTAATSASPAGSYPILVSQGTLAAANYSFTFVSGTLIISPAMQTPTLSLLNNYFVTGDHIVRSFQYSGSQTNGFVNGTITIPGATSTDPEAVQGGADIIAAFLYWQTLETTSTPSASAALFNGYSITGDVVGIDIPNTCGSTSTVRSYRANVLPYLPVVNGVSQAAATHTVGLPAGLNGSPQGSAAGLPGASLVIVYRVIGPNYLKATVIYDGNSEMVYPAPSYLNLPIRGFYDALYSDGLTIANAKFTDILGTVTDDGTNVSLLPLAGYTWPQTVNGIPHSIGQISDHASQITQRPNPYQLLPGGGQCYTWSATVFTTRVHSADGDGLLDAWKLGPAQPDPHAGQPGYYDVRNNDWIDLAGAQPGHRDLFVQLDYMVGTDGHSHQPSPDALSMVQNAFSKHNIYVHFVPGNAITEDICSDDNTTLCMFPGEPGVVAWKTGLEVMKAWPADWASCLVDATKCAPRFQPGRKDSTHYVLFGHSLALPTWSVLANTLVSLQVNGSTATVTTSAPISTCPTRITIDGVLGNPNVSGVYFVANCQGATLNLSNVSSNVGAWSYPNNLLPEPQLAIYVNQTDTTSGFSDVGGGDTTVTLGKWGTQAQLVNVQAGTLMHELGHSLGLTHGGRYHPNGSTTPAFEPNCKPNYQSVMNYLFQVDLLQSDAQGDLVLDYSDRILNTLGENDLSQSQGLTGAAYPYTKWYAPYSPVGSPASSHCDGTPIGPNEQPMYAMAGAAYPIGWSTSQDINFDGTYVMLDGYSDWDNIDLRQIGSSGNDNINGIIYLYDNQYQWNIGPDLFSGGGGIKASGGGGGIKASGGGGGIKASGGGGGIKASGGGGGIKASGGGGGIKASGGGGGVGEADYATIDSYARPPRAISAQNGVVSWKAPTFGNVQQYNIYKTVNNVTTLIATVNAATTTYTDPSWTTGQNATYYVTTVDLNIAGQPRESTPASIKAYQAALTVNVATPLTYSSSETLSTSGGSGSGAVTYSLVSGPCRLSGAQLTANSGAGSCSVTATKDGDSNYDPVTSAAVTVNLQKANTTTALSATPNPANFGQSVSLTATVAPVAPGVGTPTGTVTFRDGSTLLTTVTMSNAAATFTTASLAAGTHNLTASYSGDANFTTSSSATLAEQVVCGVLLGISPSSVRAGGKITVTGQVISCATTAQTVVVKFSLSGPLQPNKCGNTKSDMFTTPAFTLPARTSKSVSFTFSIPSGACPGTYSITATTLVNGTVVNTSTASLTITAR